MKNLINKITKSIILPLAVAGGIYDSGFSQTTTDSLIKYNLENKQVYEDFVNFIKEYGKKSDSMSTQGSRLEEISYLKIIKEIENDEIFFASLDSDENFGLIQLGFFKSGYSRKFLDNYPWGIDGNDMYLENNIKKDNEEFNNDEIKMIKNLLTKEQLKASQEYTKIIKEIMHNEKYKKY